MKRPLRDVDPAVIDLAKLPPEVAAHVEKIIKGGELRLIRAGRTVATLTRSDGIVEGVVLDPNPSPISDGPPAANSAMTMSS